MPIFQGTVEVLSNKEVAPSHYVICLQAPLLSKEIQPGQFVQIRIEKGLTPFLPRPFSILSIEGDRVDILYSVVGKGTELLSQKKEGDSIDLLGPLGNGWSPIDPNQKNLLIGGGVGIPPLYFLTQQNQKERESIEVYLGGRNQALLLYQKEFEALGVKVHVATDDGSAGFKGVVTELLKEQLTKGEYIYACGPEKMLKAVAQLAQEKKINGEVSMEAPMACGFGICVGCAIPSINGGYQLCCREGSVFKIDQIDWSRIE